MGEFEGYIGSCVDYHELVEIQAKLMLSERNYRAIVEDQTELICKFDPSHYLITFANGAYCRHFGLEKEELIGTKFPFADAAEDLTVDYPVKVVEVINGNAHWLSWTLRLITDEQVPDAQRQ